MPLGGHRLATRTVARRARTPSDAGGGRRPEDPGGTRASFWPGPRARRRPRCGHRARPLRGQQRPGDGGQLRRDAAHGSAVDDDLRERSGLREGAEALDGRLRARRRGRAALPKRRGAERVASTSATPLRVRRRDGRRGAHVAHLGPRAGRYRRLGRDSKLDLRSARAPRPVLRVSVRARLRSPPRGAPPPGRHRARTMAARLGGNAARLTPWRRGGRSRAARRRARAQAPRRGR